MKKIGILFLQVIFLGLLVSSCGWYESPEHFTFTLDKYEAKAGDEITVDTNNYDAFEDTQYVLHCTGKDGDSTCELKFVKKINSHRATFKVSENAKTSSLTLEYKKLNDCEAACSPCVSQGEVDDAVTFTSATHIGNSDKDLTVTE